MYACRNLRNLHVFNNKSLSFAVYQHSNSWVLLSECPFEQTA